MRSLTTKLTLCPIILFALGGLAGAQAAKPANHSTLLASAANKASDAGATRSEVEELRGEVAAQRQTIEEMKAMMQQMVSGSGEAANALHEAKEINQPTAIPAVFQAMAEPEKKSEKKPREDFTFHAGGATLQIYGHGDVSLDYVDNGISAAQEAAQAGLTPAQIARANNGWMTQMSSNLSYLGFRGSRPFNHYLIGVFQIETEVNFSGNPGPTSDMRCAQCIGSRDTYVGIEGPWGAFKIGKTDAPYKKASAPLDPFLNSIGDSRSIMGNSGGDNRAEFETRLSHALWYETPKLKGKLTGFSLAVLFSPGQNRSSDNSAYARGEPNCSGGNGAFVLSPQNQANVVEGANLTTLANNANLVTDPCQDGSWGNIVSTVLGYKGHGLNVFGAYEYHANVNRQVDYPTASMVENEGAWKIGTQYTFKKTRTTGNFIYEKLKRYNAPGFANLDERSRPLATWVAITQKITKTTDFNIAWGYAGKTPGDPGFGALPVNTVNNSTNLYDIGIKQHFTRKMSAYFVYARQANHADAHYDLGAVGHGIVVDKRDFLGNGIVGTRLQGVSGGMTYDF